MGTILLGSLSLAQGKRLALTHLKDIGVKNESLDLANCPGFVCNCDSPACGFGNSILDIFCNPRSERKTSSSVLASEQ